MIVLRLLLRFIVVPLGYLAATMAGTCIILFGSWKAGTLMLSDNPDTATAAFFGALVAGPVLLVVLLAVMWLPASVGILISEAFAIRSWIFHALNGMASGWVGWQMFGKIDTSDVAMNDPQYVIAAGIAGGFAYWAVAGWSAGFWKPLFARPAPPVPAPPPQMIPPPTPLNPPARTEP
jgi:hypothetical protein